MADLDLDTATAGRPGPGRGAAEEDLRPIPRIAIQAFCETQSIAAVMEAAAQDRRMSRAHMKTHLGGLPAATEFYQSAPTPNLIFVESKAPPGETLETLERLAAVCDAGTKVVVIGHVNDVVLYRELLRRGVSEYMVAPFTLFDVVRTIGDLYFDPQSEPLGRMVAFVSAKGGAGSSTIAHNVAFSMARRFGTDVVIADLDLAFGTAGLDFNQDPPQGIADALQSPDRLDDVFLDRILAKCADHLSLLAAPATLDRTYDLGESALDNVLDVVRQNVPTVVVDIPHVWTSWAKRLLTSADEIVLVAEPDLANLRNAKNIVDQLKALRPNDSPPRFVINQAGMPKRPEIKPDDFKKALEIEPLAVIPFDAQLFGSAANNGQMVAEINAKSPAAEIFDTIAKTVTGRTEVLRTKKPGSLAPILSRLGVARKKSA